MCADVAEAVAPYAGEVGGGTGDPTTVGQEVPIPAVEVNLHCKRHKLFAGLRRPRNGCVRCIAIYQYKQATGVRETRKRRADRQTNA